MNILMVCSEFAPLAKTGGLADAVTGLSNALSARGHDVRVLLPKYEHLAGAGTEIRPAGAAAAKYRYFEVVSAAAAGTAAAQARGAAKAVRARGMKEAAAGARATATPVRARGTRTPGGKGRRVGPRIYLLDLAELTPGKIYHGDERDAGRFLRLADAAVELADALDWQPDVLHCHDWHAALVPLVQRARGPARSVPTALTLHNIGYQGVFADDVLATYDLEEVRAVTAPDAFAGDTINFLRAGLRAADVVTTVSPTYAVEVRTPAFGMGLEDVLNERAGEVVGILNGVEYDVWSPNSDPFIDTHYDATDVSPKYRIKGALGQRTGLLPDQDVPLLGVVSRLATQKGIDLVAAVLPTLIAATRANFVFLGDGDATLAAELRRLAAAHPRRIAFTEGYDEPLAHQIFAGSDILLVPSRYEPCGLTQMYALRYGTIPVVRATGGLADTIEHFDPAAGTGNGSVFRDADPSGLLWGVGCALAWFDDPTTWSRLIANAMAADFSWRKQVRHYEVTYRRMIEQRGE
jgi:starch synthase